MYDMLLFLHALSAFVLVTAEVLFTVLLLTARRVESPVDGTGLFRLARPGGIAVAIGSIGVLVFGVWLAIYVDGYELWDGWILAAIVLWAIYGAVGGFTGKQFERARAGAVAIRGPRLLALKASTWVLVVLFLLDCAGPGRGGDHANPDRRVRRRDLGDDDQTGLIPPYKLLTVEKGFPLHSGNRFSPDERSSPRPSENRRFHRGGQAWPRGGQGRRSDVRNHSRRP